MYLCDDILLCGNQARQKALPLGIDRLTLIKSMVHCRGGEVKQGVRTVFIMKWGILMFGVMIVSHMEYYPEFSGYSSRNRLTRFEALLPSEQSCTCTFESSGWISNLQPGYKFKIYVIVWSISIYSLIMQF